MNKVEMPKSQVCTISTSQLKELTSEVVKAVPDNMSRSIYDEWMKNRRSLRRGIRELLLPPENQVPVIDANPLIGQFAEEWEKHYCDEYELKMDFSAVRVPIQRPGFGWLMFVAQGLACNQVYTKCESLFPCWRYTEDLNASVQGRNDREPTDHYAIWLRDRVEPDEELKGFSANQLAALGFSGNTLLEGLVLEPWHFKRTNGEHLNTANWNLCSGSRGSDGCVPCVRWSGGRFRVCDSSPGPAHGDLRSRPVVS